MSEDVCSVCTATEELQAFLSQRLDGMALQIAYHIVTAPKKKATANAIVRGYLQARKRGSDDPRHCCFVFPFSSSR